MNKVLIATIALATTMQVAQAQKKKRQSVPVKKITTANAANSLTGPFTVKLNVQGLPENNGRFFLRTQFFNDSAKVVNGEVQFSNELKEPTTAYLMYYPAADLGKDLRQVRVQRKNYYTFYLSPGTTTLQAKDSLAAASILNPNEYQQQFSLLENKQKAFEETNMRPLITQYYAAAGSGDRAKAEKLSASLDSLSEVEKETIFKPFIIENGANSPVAVTTLSNYAGYDITPAKVEPLLAKIGDQYKQLPTIVGLTEKIAMSKATGIGQEAIDFTQNDTLGHPVSLKDFRGKYVLVDFWASWCGPCRAENPNVVDAFKKYKDKNFTILGVSFDSKKENWIKAIHEDGLTWNQVSDLQYWNNAVGKIYGIQSIPSNMLIDPQGKIVAKNIRGEELQTTLAKLLN